MSMPLEIHHINVSQGDSTLIIWRDLVQLKEKLDVIPDETEIRAISESIPEEDYLPYALKNNVDLSGTVEFAILIDAGEDMYGVDVYDYLVKNGVTERERFDVVVTHCHSDHVDGIRNIFWSSWDREEQYEQRFVPIAVYDCFGGMLGKAPQTASYELYMKEVDKLESEGLTEHIYVEPGLEINLGDFGATGTLLRCVGANGATFSADEVKKGYCRELKTYAKAERSKKAIDPNALSICSVLEHAGFRYFLGGDIAGTGDEQGGNKGINKISGELPAFSKHPDVETDLRDLLKSFYPKERNSSCSCDGHMCGLKISHHGSATSNDIYTLGMMQPKIAVISSGIKAKFHHHPSQECLNRLDADRSAVWQDYESKTKRVSDVPNSIENYYITEMAADNRSENFIRTLPRGKILGDIIVRPVIESTENTEQGITIQVFGSGGQSAIGAGKWELRNIYRERKKHRRIIIRSGRFFTYVISIDNIVRRMRMEIIENQNGEHILRNLDNQGNGEFHLGNLQNICIPPFYMGLDSSLRPICMNIAFDPEQSENRYEDANQVGLYHVLSLRIDGFSVPGSVFPELEHTCDYQYKSYTGTYWPAVISMNLLKEAENVRIEDVPPVYALNNIMKNPACTFTELFEFEAPFGFLGCPSPEEGQSSVAALRMPIGLDFLGPFEEELEEMLSSEGKEPFADVTYPEGQTSRRFIEAKLNMKYEEFDRIQEYEKLRLFRYRDPENYNSYICVKWIEERRILFFELESYEVEECQKKRMAKIFHNYKKGNNKRLIRKKETVDYGSDILYEMNGTVFILSGHTYVLWMQDGGLIGGSEYLEWNVKMIWNADKLDFEQCQIVDDRTRLAAKIIKCTSNNQLLCLEKVDKAVHSETFTEGNPHQSIWFQRE